MNLEHLENISQMQATKLVSSSLAAKKFSKFCSFFMLFNKSLKFWFSVAKNSFCLPPEFQLEILE